MDLSSLKPRIDTNMSRFKADIISTNFSLKKLAKSMSELWKSSKINTIYMQTVTREHAAMLSSPLNGRKNKKYSKLPALVTVIVMWKIRLRLGNDKWLGKWAFIPILKKSGNLSVRSFLSTGGDLIIWIGSLLADMILTKP